MTNERNTTRADERINPVPSDKERMEREAHKLAHKVAECEHEFDDMQKPFTK